MSSFWLSPQEGSLHRSEGALVAIKIAKRARAELGSGSTVRHGKVVANPDIAMLDRTRGVEPVAVIMLERHEPNRVEP